MFMLNRKQKDRPAGAPGHRAYAIGDIHGRLDLVDLLLDKIHAELDERPARRTMLVFVGDLIDRGPYSAQVVERLRTYSRPGVRPVFILGNHEEVLLRVYDGDLSLLPNWLQFGGAQCLASYGVDALELRAASDARKIEYVRSAIPPEHVEFLKSFVDTCRFGDYLFVHAGIRPGIRLDEQRQSDLRWIREPFLQDDTNHGFVVVHGHTITSEVDEHPNRIGIDTGAFTTGVLTALAIEGRDRWYLDTRATAELPIPATH